MASITEVADGIYRVNVGLPGAPVTYSFFVIRDDQPALVETGFGRLFDETAEAVKRLIDPAKLRYIVVPHLEGDECGALNRFLDLAPNAQAIGSPIGASFNLSDLAIREPVAVDEKAVLELGQHRLRFLITPYVHTWDSLLAYEETTGTLFCSDLFIQPGSGPATTDLALIEEMLAVYRLVGIFPSQAHLNAALDKIEVLNPRVLACHHGSVVTGQIPAYLQALRENDVTGVMAWNPMRERGY
ncbi:MAG TPA: FprA family A-type flavoprotein [Dehalococcoidia bacterium]|nr:FprA family A-type flavoprotein [Dehalococcoidia bacterium]HLB12808.1 FprA family A-type flavoprotein [Dehalococcoidia bacterium]